MSKLAQHALTETNLFKLSKLLLEIGQKKSNITSLLHNVLESELARRSHFYLTSSTSCRCLKFKCPVKDKKENKLNKINTRN